MRIAEGNGERLLSFIEERERKLANGTITYVQPTFSLQKFSHRWIASNTSSTAHLLLTGNCLTLTLQADISRSAQFRK